MRLKRGARLKRLEMPGTIESVQKKKTKTVSVKKPQINAKAAPNVDEPKVRQNNQMAKVVFVSLTFSLSRFRPLG